jgi:hypothetical protein
MSDLNIIEVVIEDSIGQLAKTCTLMLAADDGTGENPPVAEFGMPGDDMRTGATSIRPNGVFIDIIAGYNGVPPHVIFSGAIEYMDDLEDPDALTYKIVLSEVPRGFPHKQKRSGVWNMDDKGEDEGWQAIGSHGVLSDICGKAGISLGRCDFPNYSIWGTYEISQQAPVDVAASLFGPFNVSEHDRFYVRVDRNGLHVIEVDYTEIPTVNTYEPPHLLDRTSSYQVFIPDRSADGGDILLTGGDKFTNKMEAIGHWIVDAVHTYHEDSEDSMKGVGVTRSTEKWSDFRFKVELAIQKETMGENVSLDIPYVPSDGQDINDIVNAVKAGDFHTCTILESYCWHVVEDVYGPIRGEKTLIIERETYVEYEEQTFRGDSSLVDTSLIDTTKTVPVYDETVESHLCADGLAPTHMTRNWYTYDEVGNASGTVTAEYYYCRGWHLAKVNIQSGENAGVTNAQIQFYLNAWNSLDNPPAAKPPEKGVRFSYSKAPLCKYMLLNGKILEPLLIPKPHGHSSFTVSEEYWKSLRQSRAALQVSGPGMDYGGLGTIYSYLQAASRYQTGVYYWHIVQATYSLDTTPVVGESIKVAGVNGICESFKHIIDGDAAVTKLTMKRLTSGV